MTITTNYVQLARIELGFQRPSPTEADRQGAAMVHPHSVNHRTGAMYGRTKA
ncbi:MAG: hypothetical protein R2867_45905 [Caldilineaceae bacterium]